MVDELVRSMAVIAFLAEMVKGGLVLDAQIQALRLLRAIGAAAAIVLSAEIAKAAWVLIPTV